MTAHRSLADNLVADYKLIDPGDNQTVTLDRSPAFLDVETAAAESRELAAPLAVGLELTICLNVDGGTLTVTQEGTGTFNQNGDTTLTFADAGDLVTLVSVDVGGTLLWKIKSNDGVALSS